jgi:hypothetical protein
VPFEQVGAEHVPHDATLRALPQLSAAVRAPQFLPMREQNVASVSGVQPQTLGVPPPPQVTPAPVHDPHDATERPVPQLSVPLTLPQFFPSRVQNAASLSAVQPQTLGVPPPPQLCGAVHAPPQLTVRELPQLLGAVTLPQFFPSLVQNTASVSGVQPQRLAVPPPPQVCGGVHDPHDATERPVPQLSVPITGPQLLPRRVQNELSDSAVQPHRLAVPPPAQVCGGVHAPHDGTVRDAPQLSLPVTLPQSLPSLAQNAGSVSGAQPHALAVPPPAQVCGGVHEPHDGTVRDAPQLSAAVTLPQFFPSRVQKVALSSAVHPHTFGVPLPPHVMPVALHMPHEATARDAPQLSSAVTLPQFFPSRVQKVALSSAVQPQTLLAPQVCGAVHVPHDATVRLVPQLSGAVTLPQFVPSRVQNAVFVSGVHVHTLPPPQVCGAVHVPQLTV